MKIIEQISGDIQKNYPRTEYVGEIDREICKKRNNLIACLNSMLVAGIDKTDILLKKNYDRNTLAISIRCIRSIGAKIEINGDSYRILLPSNILEQIQTIRELQNYRDKLLQEVIVVANVKTGKYGLPSCEAILTIAA